MAERFAAYWTETGAPGPERTPFGVRRILRAAHYLATRWEFEYLSHGAEPLRRGAHPEENINGRLREHLDMPVVKECPRFPSGNGNELLRGFRESSGTAPLPEALEPYPGFPRPRCSGTCSSWRS